MRSFIVIALCLLLIQVVNAASITSSEFNVESFFNQVPSDDSWQRIIVFLDQFNNYYKSLPDIVKNVIGNEVVRLEITFDDGSKKIVGVKTERGMITDYSEEPYNDSTLAIYLTERVVIELLSSRDPLQALRDAWGKDIRYEGLNFYNSLKVFLVNIGFRIYSFFAGLTAMPVTRSLRSEGIIVDLSDWWDDVPSDSSITIDPLGGSLYLYWLDEYGNICHGNPGVNGQPGPIVIPTNRFIELRTKHDEGARMTLEASIAYRTDTYLLGSYDGQGLHIVQYRNQYWRDRSSGIVFEDYRAIQSSYLGLINLGDYISPGHLNPKAMLILNGYDCALTSDRYLPVPPPLIGEQDPSVCLTKQSITASTINNACRDGTLTGGFADGYLRIVS